MTYRVSIDIHLYRYIFEYNDVQAYVTPSYFSADWLMEYRRLPESRPIVERFARHEHRRLARREAKALNKSTYTYTAQRMSSEGEGSAQTPARDYCFTLLGPKVRSNHNQGLGKLLLELYYTQLYKCI